MKARSKPLPPSALLGLIILLALSTTGLNASGILPGQPPSALASYSVEQVNRQFDGQKIQSKQGALLSPLTPTGTGFTYQGSLKSGGNPVTGSYDLVFTLFDASSAGNQISTPVTLTNQTVTSGLFTVSLDFGSSAFDGNARYLEIAVRQSGGGSYTTLSPRQPITPAPYALFALKTQPYKNVATVAQSGGQFTSVSAALASITDNSPANRYLIKVSPGTYTETVTMKQWVDIEGSGEKTTKITYTGSGLGNTGTVVGANNAELRSLTVENTGVNNYAIAIYNSNASPSLLHVTATASGASAQNVGVSNTNSSPTMSNVAANTSGGNNNIAVSNDSSSAPTMNNVTATASGGTIDNYAVDNYNSSSPTMSNVTANASGGDQSIGIINSASSPSIVAGIISAGGASTNYGVYSYNSSTVKIDDSKISVPLTSTTIFSSSGSAQVGASRLSGGPIESHFATVTCSASFDGNNTRLGSLCTPDTKVVYVATTGGDFTSIQAALNSITDNSSTNPYLIRVGPGTYTETVTMVPYVDIEGSGEKSTKITYTGSPSNNTGTVVGASNAELRSLTVENTGGNTYAIGIYNSNTSPSLLHVTATASGATQTSLGIYNTSSSPTMNYVTASASGGASGNAGVDNFFSAPTMNNVTATGTGGSSGNIYGVINDSSPSTMTNVTATGSGGANSHGVININTSPGMSNVVSTASGAPFNYGVQNANASPAMTNVTASGSGGSSSTNYGVYNNQSSPKIVTSIISASGGSTNYGVASFGSGTVTIDNSKITTPLTSNTIQVGAGVTTRVGASKLDGGPVSNAGTLTCAAIYDENYLFFSNTCP